MGCADNQIARWSAPECELRFRISVEKFIKKIRITFAQGNDESGNPKIVVVKTEKDCEFSQNVIKFGLTQEETLSFDPNEYIQIEIQAYDIHGVPYIGDTIFAEVKDVINEGVSW